MIRRSIKPVHFLRMRACGLFPSWPHSGLYQGALQHQVTGTPRRSDVGTHLLGSLGLGARAAKCGDALRVSPVLLVRPLLAAHYLRACGRDEGPPRALPLCPGASRRRCCGRRGGGWRRRRAALSAPRPGTFP